MADNVQLESYLAEVLNIKGAIIADLLRVVHTTDIKAVTSQCYHLL